MSSAQPSDKSTEEPTLDLSELNASQLEAAKLKAQLAALASSTGLPVQASGAAVHDVGDGEEDEDDEEEDDASVDGDEDGYYTGIMLGMLEKPSHPVALRRDYFPSKAGGMPVSCCVSCLHTVQSLAS